MRSRWFVIVAAALVIAGNQIAASADPGANPPQSPIVEDRTGGWLNTVTHVYVERHQYRGADGALYDARPDLPYSNGAYWMFSATQLRVKVSSLSADALASTLRSKLSPTWSSATRGYGTIQIVDGEYDIEIFTIGGEGISYHIAQFVQGRAVNHQFLYETNRGVPYDRNIDVALVATHEIGHIWCCHGNGTDGTGHWYTAGVPTSGIMNDRWYVDWPGVDWTTFTTRELATMGIFPK